MVSISMKVTLVNASSRFDVHVYIAVEELDVVYYGLPFHLVLKFMLHVL